MTYYSTCPVDFTGFVNVINHSRISVERNKCLYCLKSIHVQCSEAGLVAGLLNVNLTSVVPAGWDTTCHASLNRIVSRDVSGTSNLASRRRRSRGHVISPHTTFVHGRGTRTERFIRHYTCNHYGTEKWNSTCNSRDWRRCLRTGDLELCRQSCRRSEKRRFLCLKLIFRRWNGPRVF